MENAIAAKIAVLTLLVGIFLTLVFVIGSGRMHTLSEPITDLEPGKVYEVRGLTRDGESCFLLLKAGDAIDFYQLPSNEVPADLEAGDGLVKLSTGLSRLPD